MKNKWSLISSIFQLVIGAFAVVTFAIVGLNGENITKWIVTLILSAAFIILGIIGIIEYKAKD